MTDVRLASESSAPIVIKDKAIEKPKPIRKPRTFNIDNFIREYGQMLGINLDILYSSSNSSSSRDDEYEPGCGPYGCWHYTNDGDGRECILITEVHWNPSDYYNHEDGLYEFIELTNICDYPVNLKNWAITTRTHAEDDINIMGQEQEYWHNDYWNPEFVRFMFTNTWPTTEECDIDFDDFWIQPDNINDGSDNRNRIVIAANWDVYASQPELYPNLTKCENLFQWKPLSSGSPFKLTNLDLITINLYVGNLDYNPCDQVGSNENCYEYSLPSIINSYGQDIKDWRGMSTGTIITPCPCGQVLSDGTVGPCYESHYNYGKPKWGWGVTVAHWNDHFSLNGNACFGSITSEMGTDRDYPGFTVGYADRVTYCAAESCQNRPHYHQQHSNELLQDGQFVGHNDRPWPAGSPFFNTDGSVPADMPAGVWFWDDICMAQGVHPGYSFGIPDEESRGPNPYNYYCRDGIPGDYIWNVPGDAGDGPNSAGNIGSSAELMLPYPLPWGTINMLGRSPVYSYFGRPLDKKFGYVPSREFPYPDDYPSMFKGIGGTPGWAVPYIGYQYLGHLPGDVNLDGEVNVLDVINYVNCIVEEWETEQCQNIESSLVAEGLLHNVLDVNGDGLFNILDIVLMVSNIVNGVYVSSIDTRDRIELERQLERLTRWATKPNSRGQIL
jgi:hypothetical protein